MAIPRLAMANRMELWPCLNGDSRDNHPSARSLPYPLLCGKSGSSPHLRNGSETTPGQTPQRLDNRWSKPEHLQESPCKYPPSPLSSDVQYYLFKKTDVSRIYKLDSNSSICGRLAVVKHIPDIIENTDARKGKTAIPFQKKLLNAGIRTVLEGAPRNGSFMQINGMYSADIAYFEIESGILLDIEIDEPYHFRNSDQLWKDETRNLFFLNHRWNVLRFSEHAIINEPERCVQDIINVIKQLQKEYSEIRKAIERPQKVPASLANRGIMLEPPPRDIIGGPPCTNRKIGSRRFTTEMQGKVIQPTAPNCLNAPEKMAFQPAVAYQKKQSSRVGLIVVLAFIILAIYGSIACMLFNDRDSINRSLPTFEQAYILKPTEKEYNKYNNAYILQNPDAIRRDIIKGGPRTDGAGDHIRANGGRSKSSHRTRKTPSTR